MSKIGRGCVTQIGGSLAPATSLYEEIMGHGQYTGSFTETVQNVIEALPSSPACEPAGRSTVSWPTPLSSAPASRSANPATTGSR